MGQALSRRSFLRLGAAPSVPSVRPPWASEDFIRLCDGCGACLTACSPRLLRRDGEGLPIADFSAASCDFCGDCLTVCTRGALVRSDDDAPWSLRAEIGRDCLSWHGVTCRVCGDFCETRAIRFPLTVGGGVRPELDVAACTGCGACIAPCPAQAIEMKG
ncbi:MAG TPA: ferredoxin-type protein NapF [Candidatus Sulfotelmatobacter sp.]|nr:ferredoxin-type protein NapF [Candidatus Sulfotelmatobacter sp.]